MKNLVKRIKENSTLVIAAIAILSVVATTFVLYKASVAYTEREAANAAKAAKEVQETINNKMDMYEDVMNRVKEAVKNNISEDVYTNDGKRASVDTMDGGTIYVFDEADGYVCTSLSIGDLQYERNNNVQRIESNSITLDNVMELDSALAYLNYLNN